MNIALCGYMGSGKTTVGEKLASILNFNFVDTDKIIEENERMSIHEIFDVHGEKYFRQKEIDVITNVVKLNNTIISLGGGAVLRDENVEILKQNCVIIYIDTDFEVCYDRIKRSSRPIVKSKSKEELKTHYNSRIDKYKNIADIIVIGNDLVKNVTSEIIHKLNEVEK